jgi:hypothetical protein
LIKYPEIYTFFLIPFALFYTQILFLFFLRIIIIAILLFFYLDFVSFLKDINIVIALFIIINFFPFQLKYLKGLELKLRILLLILEMVALYGFLIKQIYSMPIVLILFVLVELSFYFIKNRLFYKTI